MSRKAYPKYKPSGIEWLGEIPEHWETKRLKYVSSITTGDKDTVDSIEDGEYPFFVRSQTVERLDTYTYDGEAVLTAGDGVGVAKVFHYINGKFDFHQRVYKFSDFKKVMGKYFYYYIKENFYKDVLKLSAKSTVDSLRLPMIQNFMFAVPSIDEQLAIAAFLDRETERMDSLIAKKERQIELLQEKRSALISHVVTKGLDPSAKMKDSGIEWLGEIPANWEVKRLKHVGDAVIGLTYEPSYVVDQGDGILVLRASNVSDGRIVFEDNVFVKTKIPERLITKVGDILICSRSGSRALIGKNAKIDRDSAGVTFGTFMTVFRSVCTSYLFYVFNSTLFDYQSGAFLTSTINQLTVGNLYSFEVPIPPLSEQSAIAHYLDLETTKIDTLIKKVQASIETLREYRTALISAAVTGKINVREEVS
jgi:type I restriction enzyme S subunit